ncbi:hypothetical protein [Desulfohalovibrio reitneri]|uniref:hypothetical protein n=1 Tax=Desulfohalovibrio reitneri TaxID=1307759 RepID=UPI000B06130D|nr:hypothetical protein [Desulfohalovibrio reitneri]
MDYGIDTIFKLVTDMTHSTLPGTIGVSLIFIYLVWMVTMAGIRIHNNIKNEHDHH